MTDWSWQHLGRVHLIWVAIAIVVGLVVLEVRSRGAMTTFLSQLMQRRLAARASFARTLTRLGLVLACLVFGVLALMQPTARGETASMSTTEANADVLFVLDVSRSMLAVDASPTRLARAKAEIDNLVKQLDGDNVGLVVFAGRAVEMCALTMDYAYFSSVLATVSTSSAGRGGTKIGAAIKDAVNSFPPNDGAKLMVLITDGDDQDKYTQDAAKAARDAGVKIVAIGIGSETGSTIDLKDPETGAVTKLMHDGKPVISKLDAETLRKVALTTEGAYIPAGTAAVDLASIMQSHVKPLIAEAKATALRPSADERFLWPLLASLLCLLASLWVGAGAGDKRVPEREARGSR
jgi:Ca-activated chloride channel homolog